MRAAPGGTVASVPGTRGTGVVSTGVASLAVRDVLRGPRRPGKVLAVLPHAICVGFGEAVPEPRVVAISPPDALRLPNAIIAGPFQAQPPSIQDEVPSFQDQPPSWQEQVPSFQDRVPSWQDRVPSFQDQAAAECWAGDGRVLACGLEIRVIRWWDPTPVFGPLSRARLDHGCGILAKLCSAAAHEPGLDEADGPGRLAACCAAGDLAGAVEAVEQLVGLGPGLVPSGDSMVSGVLLALRLLGGAISGGTRAVWLANWLSAAATCDATARTSALAASLLHCAAGGQAGAEVSAVLLGMAGQEPLEPAAGRLLASRQGADLAWGLVAGGRAALRLSVS